MKHKIKFPKDEQAHKKIIEWWYFNGNLEDKKRNEYSFMDCLFKVDVKKVKIPFIRTPFKTAYFSHSLICNIKKRRSYPEVNHISIISSDSFSKRLLFLNYLNPSLKGYVNYEIEEIRKFKYHLKTKNLDLILTSIKKPLLEGGKGFIRLNPEKTYYYSLTNLKTEGNIKINGKWIPVKGKSWMDHQWADIPYNKNKWTWFSIQLEGDTEIVCFKYSNGKNKTFLANISYPNNNQKQFSEIEFKPLGSIWKSKKTGTAYPLSWEIKIPQENISLKVEPLNKNQEINFGTINYWEGPLKINGKIKNKKVKGKGFMELMGYPSDYTKTQLLKKEAILTLKKSLNYAKKEIKRRIK